MRSYDYSQRKGVKEISWVYFARLAATLAELLDADQVEAVVGIARAGLFPATAVACALRRDLYPVQVTRRHNDQVLYEHPQWKVDVTKEVKGKIIAVIDDIADVGETLALVAGRVREQGAQKVITASLVGHSWAEPKPDHAALVTDAFVIFPWDKQVYQEGHWQIHPEVASGLKMQRPRQRKE